MYKKLSGRSTVALVAVATAQFMVALDMAVMNVALPSIRADLGFAPLDLAWVVHIYALTFGGFLLLGGSASDLFGRRRLLTAGLVVFGIASLAGGLAQQPWQLVAARAVQGCAAAALAPAALAVLTTTFAAGPARVRALGVWSAVNAAGGAGGVLVGGLLTEYADWRWVLLVNLPLVVVAVVAASGAIDTDTGRAVGNRLDLLGALAATAGIGLVVTGVIRTDRYGWSAPITIATLVAGVLLLAAFVVVEKRTAAPLVRLGLFGNRWVSGANLFVFLAAGGQFAAFYLVSLYMQQVLGMGAGATGAAFLPFSAMSVAGTVIATRAGVGATPRPALIAGGLVTAAGLLWFAAIGPGGSFLGDVLGPSLVSGLGIGLCLAPAAVAAATGVDVREAGTASGVFNSSRQLGGCVGVAVLATVAASRTGTATDPVALSSGYARALLISAAVFGLAAVVAAVVLPRGAASGGDDGPSRPSDPSGKRGRVAA
ncbi:MFS transporter [Nocardia sienata]|uniref:MFS transporter n=1 Tax=Nocardia sienata TaxID=248552 RepID=UPI000AD9E063|nr:MFS transporter [Nocardia sienata]